MRQASTLGTRTFAASSQGWDSRLIVAATFPVFMLAAAGRRVMAGRALGGLRGLLTEARASAMTCAAFALMG